MAEYAAWERQAGESARSFEAFKTYANLPASERSLARAAEIVGKCHQQLLVWSSRDDWVLRAQLWDREQHRVADVALLEAIQRTSQKAVEVGMLMLDAVEEQIPEAAKSLDKSPHALARWVEGAVKLIRDGIANGELNAGAGDRNAPIDELNDLMPFLTPGDVLKLQDSSLALTEAKSRRANGLPPSTQPLSPDDAEPQRSRS